MSQTPRAADGPGTRIFNTTNSIHIISKISEKYGYKFFSAKERKFS